MNDGNGVVKAALADVGAGTKQSEAPPVTPVLLQAPIGIALAPHSLT